MSHRSLALLWLIGLTATVPAQLAAQAVRARLAVTPAQARQLILVTQTAPRFRHFMSFEPIDLTTAHGVRHADRFVAYQLISGDERYGSVNRGFWAVNLQTGDLWETFLCERDRSPAAVRFRRRVRRRSRLSAHAWQEASKERPCEPS